MLLLNYIDPIHSSSSCSSSSLSSSSSISTIKRKTNYKDFKEFSYLLIMLSLVAKILSRNGPSRGSVSSKHRVYLFSGQASPINAFLELKCSGGKKTPSSPILKEFSSIVGISLARSGLDSSRHGFVFTSIRYGLNSSHIMKSRPKTSMQFSRLFGSSLP